MTTRFSPCARTTDRTIGVTLRSGACTRTLGRKITTAVIVVCAGLLAGCSMDRLVGSASLPSNVIDPAQAETAAGAIGAYRTTLALLRDVMGAGDSAYVTISGQFADELQDPSIGAPLYYNAGFSSVPDSRMILPTTSSYINQLYANLQRLRGDANQARGLLTDFYPDSSGPLIAHMMVATGYAELLLAESFCSGIPLSTLDYKGDFTYRAGSSTDQVAQHAIALFDSALAIVGDSDRVASLARVGKGRAYVLLGQWTNAANAVTDVPTTFTYTMMYSDAAGVYGLRGKPNDAYVGFQGGSVSDREGGNGLPFRTESDGRLPTFTTGSRNAFNVTLIIPTIPTPSTITLASGVEARLIEAEAALAANDATWLSLLNTLRTNGTYTVTGTDTAWAAGTGGVARLAPLTDPGLGTLPAGKTAMDLRVDLLFRERAYWMFLTGHRLGDLRRLVRVYHRDPETVFPTGVYQGNVAAYGTDVTLPVPQTEQDRNPLYQGCINRDA